MSEPRPLIDLAHCPVELAAATYEAAAADADFVHQWKQHGFYDPRTQALHAYRAAAEEAFEDIAEHLAHQDADAGAVPGPVLPFEDVDAGAVFGPVLPFEDISRDGCADEEGADVDAGAVFRPDRTREDRLSRIQFGGWTLALITGPGHLYATLTRPRPLDPHRGDGPLPAWAVNISGGLSDTYPTDPDPDTAVAPARDGSRTMPIRRLRLYARRVWQRWAYPHPEAVYRSREGRIIGPWTASRNRFTGLNVRRLPEFDCPWHEPVAEVEEYFEDWYDDDCVPGEDECTCPRIRPWLNVILTRPERIPEDQPF